VLNSKKSMESEPIKIH